MEWIQNIPNSVILVVSLLVGLHLLISLVRRALRTVGGARVTVSARVVETWREAGRGSEICMATFHSSGMVLRFVVGEHTFASLSPGQKGKLTYQGTTFVRFQSRGNKEGRTPQNPAQ